MACALTQDYNLDCIDSFGGAKTISFIEIANATITETAGVVTAITKATGKVFRKYNIEAYNIEPEEAYSVSRENGTAMNKQTLKFPINKLSVSVRNELLLLGKNRLFAVIVDNNGTGWLFGGTAGNEIGMTMTSTSAKTGKILSDRNGYEISFEADVKSLAPSVDSTTLGTLYTAGT